MNGVWLAWGNTPAGLSHRAVHATDPVAERVADLHVLLGEGPAEDAGRRGEPVTSGDVTSPASRRRWPVFAGPAQAAGVRAVAVVPVRVGASGFGLFGLYSRLPGLFRTDQVADLEVYARIAFDLLLDRAAPAEVDGWVAREAEVHQATGMVAAQTGVGVAEASLRLRAHAFATARTLAETAREVVAGRLRFPAETSEQAEQAEHPP